MLRLGLLLTDLGPSELNWRLLTQANALMDADAADVVVFVQEPGPIWLEPRGAVMNAAEAWGFTGPLLGASLAAAGQILACPSASARVYYAWDLDWLRQTSPRHAELAAVYRDPRLSVVPRTAAHAALLTRCWNRPVLSPVASACLHSLFGIPRAAPAD